MDVRDLGVSLWRQRLLIVLVVLLSGAVVAVGVALSPKTYEASARVGAVKEPSSTATPDDLDVARADLATVAESAEVLGAVRLRLDVDRSPAELQDEVTARWVPGTTYIRITVRDEDRRLAARIATAVAVELAGRDEGAGVVALTVSDRASPPAVFVDPSR